MAVRKYVATFMVLVGASDPDHGFNPCQQVDDQFEASSAAAECAAGSVGGRVLFARRN